MKFEIDDKTGMILVSGKINHTYNEMEAILQAEKKTREKIVNKQILEIQDSKNMTISQPKFEINGDNIHLEGENVSIKATDPKQDAHLTIKCMEDHEKIEQNQKIVDGIFQLYNVKLRRPEFNHLREKHNIPQLDTNLKIIQSWLKFIVKESTGKDIKDL